QHDPDDCGGASTAQLIALVQSNRAVVDKVSRLEAQVDALQEENDGLKNEVSSLKRRCFETELRCEALEQSVEILKKDASWVYSAPEIPRIYWEEEEEYEDFEADQIDEAVKSMRVYCHQLRKGSAPGKVEVGPQLFDYPMSRHDILLPHWQELANALNLSRGSINLSIKMLHLDQSVMDILTPCMKNKLERFHLDGNDYTSSNMGIEFAISTVMTDQLSGFLGHLFIFKIAWIAAEIFFMPQKGCFGFVKSSVHLGQSDRGALVGFTSPSIEELIPTSAPRSDFDFLASFRIPQNGLIRAAHAEDLTPWQEDVPPDLPPPPPRRQGPQAGFCYGAN
ncbi:hypothetical protein THAOC_25040, partial [Thalassiosira oceanica]